MSMKQVLIIVDSLLKLLPNAAATATLNQRKVAAARRRRMARLMMATHLKLS